MARRRAVTTELDQYGPVATQYTGAGQLVFADGSRAEATFDAHQIDDATVVVGGAMAGPGVFGSEDPIVAGRRFGSTGLWGADIRSATDPRIG